MKHKATIALYVLIFGVLLYGAFSGGEIQVIANNRLHKLLVQDQPQIVSCKLIDVSPREHVRYDPITTVFLECPFPTEPLIFSSSLHYNPTKFGEPVILTFLDKANCILSIEGPISPSIPFKKDYSQMLKWLKQNPKTTRRINASKCINIKAIA